MDNWAIYDNLTYMLSINLFSLNKSRDTINLYGADPKDPEHQWVIDTAIMCIPLYGKRLRTDWSFWTRFKFWRKHRKMMKFIHKAPAHKTGDPTVPEILEFMRPAANSLAKVDRFDFGDITRARKGFGEK